MRNLAFPVAGLAFLLVGCGTVDVPQQPLDSLEILAPGPGNLTDTTHQTGSSTIGRYVSMIFNVNPDANTVSVFDTQTNTVLAEILVGAEPTRLAVVGDQVFITLRGERAVAVLSATDFDLAPRLIDVGAEPFGVVAREDGQRVYVSLSQSNQVIEIDGDSHRILRTFEVEGEPRYLALHPSGAALFVGSARDKAELTRIDLRTGSASTVQMPSTRRLKVDGDHIDLIPRITGDLWITSDGGRLLVPTLFVDNETPIVEMQYGREVEDNPAAELMSEHCTGPLVIKFNPSVVEVPVSALGEPDDPRALFLATRFSPGPFASSVDVGSYVTSVTASPAGTHYLATMEASDVAVLIDPNTEKPAINAPGFSQPEEGLFLRTHPVDGGFSAPKSVVLDAQDGTNGAIYLSEGRAVLNDAHANTLSLANMSEANVTLQDDGIPDSQGTTPRVVSNSPLPPNVRLGRDLFYSATNEAVVQGGRVSCSTCHVDGRDDGLTWAFETGKRQTPSLAGMVSETTPLTWMFNIPSVAAEAEITARVQMGGEGMSLAQLDAIAAFVDDSRDVDTAEKGSNTLAVQRGETLFHNAEVGCVTCHSGPRGTDNQSHSIRGVNGVNTPGLTGVAATAPYMHDGTAATLRDVLEISRSGAKGDTSGLTEEELTDLEAYLRSR